MSETALLLLDLQNEMVDPRGKLGGALAGPAAERNVLANARTADDAGSSVAVLEDCRASPNPGWHEFSVKDMLPLFGTVSGAAAFAAES